jgi:hypothetical protein
MKHFITGIKHIIDQARANAVKSVDFYRIQMYWQIGHRIVEEEQGGNARSEYGSRLLQNLAKELEPDYGTGFKKRQLERDRQFYIEYPKVNAVRSQSNRTQYRASVNAVGC